MSTIFYKNSGYDVSVEVLEALRRGESWAFDEVYMKYASPLKDFIAALISNEEDAKELNHDIFLSLWTGRDKIVPERGIKGFLYMRAKNLAMNYFDHKKVKQKYKEFCSSNTDVALPPDLHVIGDEIKTLIDIFLQGLPHQRQTIFRLRHDEGLSVEEIAARLGLSQSTIKNNLSMVSTAIRNLVALWAILFYQL